MKQLYTYFWTPLIAIICFVFSITTQASTYSVNCMWINSQLQEDQTYVYPATNEQELKESALHHVFDWADVTGHHGIIQLWYDSQYTPQHAIQNTLTVCKQYAHDHPQSAPIILRDIRSLPYVATYADVFSNAIPLYMRVDILRVIAACYELSIGNTSYFVYADIDMEPLAPETLFNEETQANLDTYGIVLAKDPGNYCPYENGFFIMRFHPSLIYAHQRAIVDVNIERATRALHKTLYKENNARLVSHEDLEQSVFDSYPNMLAYFYQLERYGVIYITSYKSPYPYDENKHGLTPFGLSHIMNHHLNFYTDRDDFSGTTKNPSVKADEPQFNYIISISNTPAPIKDVPIPETHL